MRRKDSIDYEVEDIINAIQEAEDAGLDWTDIGVLSSIIEKHLREERNQPVQRIHPNDPR